MSQNLFELAKNITLDELKLFAQANGGEFGRTTSRNECYCPFHVHNHDTPSLHFKVGRDGNAFWQCFACGAGGDAAKWAELKYFIKPLEAVQKVLDHFGIPYESGQELSEERKREIAELQEKQRHHMEKERVKRALEYKKECKKYYEIAQQDAPRLIKAFADMREYIQEEIVKLFPHFSYTSYLQDQMYLGYDTAHKTIAIINQYNGKVYNIKRRQMFTYNKGEITDVRMSGKWIGLKSLGERPLPFPLEWFNQNEDERVIVCEGEKDALNLLSYGINCLTLGAATNSWDEEYGRLLEGKNVYVWFDNDEAGYRGACQRYNELKPYCKNIFIVPFFSFKGLLGKGYDISDYLADNNFKNGEEVWEGIAYNCFLLNNDIISDIEDLYQINLSHFKSPTKLLDFEDVTKQFLKTDDDGKYINVFRAKGELDRTKLEALLSRIKDFKKGSAWHEMVEQCSKYMSERDNVDHKSMLQAFTQISIFKKSEMNNYCQTHIADCVDAFNLMVKKAGYGVGEYKSSLWVWVGTHYTQVDDNTFTKFIHGQWMPAARIDKKKQTRQMAEDITQNIKSLSENLNKIKMNETRRVINCLNGTVFVSPNGKITFTPYHDKKNVALNILPFAYDKNAKAPKWAKFLNHVLPDEQDKKALMEFMGYCFLPTHEFETFLFLFGKSGANGKSVIFDTIKSFFGKDNVSALQLQQLDGHELDAMSGKLLNIGSEIDKVGTGRGQLAMLKSLVSKSDSITINPKNKDPYTLEPKDKPKLAFSGNDKPKGGLDNGVFRRMLLLSFDEEIKDRDKIRNLSDRFKDEMPGIFNLALEGLLRLKAQGYFSRGKRAIDELEEYKDEVNPIRAFVKEAISEAKGYFVPNAYLYRLYVTYIRSKGGTPCADRVFARHFKEELMVSGIKSEVCVERLKYAIPGISNQTPRCTHGIKVNIDLDIPDVNLSDKDSKMIDLKDMSLRKDMNFEF